MLESLWKAARLKRPNVELTGKAVPARLVRSNAGLETMTNRHWSNKGRQRASPERTRRLLGMQTRMGGRGACRDGLDGVPSVLAGARSVQRRRWARWHALAPRSGNDLFQATQDGMYCPNCGEVAAWFLTLT